MNRTYFTVVGPRRAQELCQAKHVGKRQDRPVLSAVLLAVLLLCCLFSGILMTKDPTHMDLMNCSVAPNREFLFGTDALGRDMFSMIWSGGRVSLFIGFTAAAISTIIAVLFGAVSGTAPAWADSTMMRLTEILLSIPSLLLIIFLQAVMGKANVVSISIVIGVTSWTAIAKVVRTEVRQLRSSEYVVAAKCMGAGFFHILWKHLTPNFISSIMFMVVMNIRSAMIAESTLSFMGIGLATEQISWGSMLSLSERALMSSSWWIILIPGIFLVATLMLITNIGNYFRKNMNRKHSNL